MKVLVVIGGVAVLLSGCATSPSNIAASYVSPVSYQNFSCADLSQEAERVSSRAAQAAGVQRDRANTDAVAMTVAVVVFWPALFFVGGDKGNGAELASLKGQMDAIEEVNRAKNCGIEFAKS